MIKRAPIPIVYTVSNRLRVRVLPILDGIINERNMCALANNRTADVAGFAREVTHGAGVNMVFDHVGTALFGPSLFGLGAHGRLVCCGNSSGDEATIPSLGYLFHSGIKIMGSDPYRPEEFRPVWEAFCSGDFEVLIDSEFALADAAEAQNKMLSSDFFGKIVLRP